MPRIKKSLQQHLLQGTQLQYEEVVQESGLVAGKPKMPKDLPEEAMQEWKRLVKALSKRGTLTSVDASALEVYVRMYQQWRAYCKEVDDKGAMVDEIVVAKDGEQITRRVQNPA